MDLYKAFVFLFGLIIASTTFFMFKGRPMKCRIPQGGYSDLEGHMTRHADVTAYTIETSNIDAPMTAVIKQTVVDKKEAGSEMLELSYNILDGKNMWLYYPLERDAQGKCIYDDYDVKSATEAELGRFACTNAVEQYVNLLGSLNPDIDMLESKNAIDAEKFTYEFLGLEAQQCIDTRNFFSNLKRIVYEPIRENSSEENILCENWARKVLVTPTIAYNSVRENIFNSAALAYKKHNEVFRQLPKAWNAVCITHRLAAANLRSEIYSLLSQFKIMDEITEKLGNGLRAMNKDPTSGQVNYIAEKSKTVQNFGIESRILEKIKECSDVDPLCTEEGSKKDVFLSHFDKKSVHKEIAKAWNSPLETMEEDLEYLKKIHRISQECLTTETLVLTFSRSSLNDRHVETSLDMCESLVKIVEKYETKADNCYTAYMGMAKEACENDIRKCAGEKTEYDEEALLYGDIPLKDYTGTFEYEQLGSSANPSILSSVSDAAMSAMQYIYYMLTKYT
ncbi:uncharacterized protein NEMAJ01_0971 [Nematocida major]|uniref:uncharacterized protein n=1 Tax=Nematocida major TaxID=1912982 RepID=UPI002008DAA6|nr:uncharacterized protein NEMAJ01_0971 [Nematocida major]KAH9386075.1 hypothetical protein NEMAJ01_0971 [Nematocida major]